MEIFRIQRDFADFIPAFIINQGRIASPVFRMFTRLEAEGKKNGCVGIDLEVNFLKSRIYGRQDEMDGQNAGWPDFVFMLEFEGMDLA